MTEMWFKNQIRYLELQQNSFSLANIDLCIITQLFTPAKNRLEWLPSENDISLNVFFSSELIIFQLILILHLSAEFWVLRKSRYTNNMYARDTSTRSWNQNEFRTMYNIVRDRFNLGNSLFLVYFKRHSS